jgi:hypothetical protein
LDQDVVAFTVVRHCRLKLLRDERCHAVWYSRSRNERIEPHGFIGCALDNGLDEWTSVPGSDQITKPLGRDVHLVGLEVLDAHLAKLNFGDAEVTQASLTDVVRDVKTVFQDLLCDLIMRACTTMV